MKASLNWIKEFAPVNAAAQEIADRLTLAGLEVEGIHAQGVGLEQVVTGTLLKVEKHPHADRLTVCEVRTLDRTHQIVCGAKNHKVGDRVAVALPGARLPNGMAIAETVLRKVQSSGMLCSEKELGLAAEGEGILILNPEIPEGIPLAEALQLNDVLLEINVTPNRGDCLSMRGLAREVAAAFGTDLVSPAVRGEAPRASQAKPIEVLLQAPELCPRYTCRVVRGVKIGPAPEWVRRRLEACGVRPINNVVDATNYVMLEMGQPLHAFDLSSIRGAKVAIRQARAGETLQTLDDKARPLNEGELVIADAERILAVAGVMGGKDSGVSDSTHDLLLESAFFAPETVRKTAKRLALQTESSYRFERGVDPQACPEALHRLAQLIEQWAGGKAEPEWADLYPRAIQPLRISMRRRTLQRVLGYEIPLQEILPPLRALGMESRSESVEEVEFEVPPRRSDITREIDLVEEAARLYGYHRIPTLYPKISLEQIAPAVRHPMEPLRDLLKAWGFSEVLHYSFTSPALLRRFEVAFDPSLELLNPLSEELSVLRPTLIPQMVETLRQNNYHGAQQLKLFEIRPVYLRDPQKTASFVEEWRLCLGISGARRGLHFMEKPEMVSLLDLKGWISDLWALQKTGELKQKPLQRPYFHPKRQSGLEGGGELGELHPAWLEEWGIRVPLAVAEIPLDLFLTAAKNQVQFKKVSSFPSVWRDLNLVIDEGVSHGDLEAAMRKHGGAWLRQIVLFDLYRGKPLAEGKKALTYTLEYSAGERTLTDEEVNQAREFLLEQLKKEMNATLR